MLLGIWLLKSKYNLIVEDLVCFLLWVMDNNCSYFWFRFLSLFPDQSPLAFSQLLFLHNDFMSSWLKADNDMKGNFPIFTEHVCLLKDFITRLQFGMLPKRKQNIFATFFTGDAIKKIFPRSIYIPKALCNISLYFFSLN